MKASDVTIDWLQNLKLNITSINTSTVEGVIIKNLDVLLDGRGEVTELWSASWKSDGFISSEHVYQSATDYGVIKCWHLHDNHTDQFTVTRGKLQVTLIDLRQDSPSFGHVNRIFLGALKPRIIKIPPMVLHGWKALSMPEVIVVNLQSHVYTPDDEYKFPWDCIIPEIWEPVNG
ncbi:MAG: dTDP-4-dehydrorhamnose 3,5-epimerase family protein [Anaerolineae bacterium]|nr:dTDP-4-dehydrorhamnose 3,5-epimerase family protein [Anaerolineae bacterium]